MYLNKYSQGDQITDKKKKKSFLAILTHNLRKTSELLLKWLVKRLYYILLHLDIG